MNIAGRVQTDLLLIISRDHTLATRPTPYRSRSNVVSFDVHYLDIALQQGDQQTRRRLAVYCLKDSLLPLLLIDKLCATVNLIFLITRGQQIKVQVLSQLYRTANPKGQYRAHGPRGAEQYTATKSTKITSFTCRCGTGHGTAWKTCHASC